MNTFLDRLRGLREDNDLTQSQVAAFLGTSQTMYARYERGANEMPLRHLVALCRLYNVSADYLLGTALLFRKQYAGCIVFYKFYVFFSSLSNETML